MKKCDMCGTTDGKIFNRRKFGKSLCQTCYRYETEHPVHPLPNKGEVVYDEEGKPICHICGRAFKKLASHAYNRHKISASDYKEMFGLNNTKGLIAESTREILREHSKNNYDKVVKENLIKKGENSRFKNGDKGRTKDKVRLQCRNVLIQNVFKNKK